MNTSNYNKNSEILLSVPYAYGDAVDGFKSDKELTSNEYAEKMVKYFNKYKDGTFNVFVERFSDNISKNQFVKEKSNVKRLTEYYEDTYINLYNENNEEPTIDELIRHFQDGEPFILVIHMYQLGRNEDLEIDINAWGRETNKIMTSNRLDPVEKMKSLSKKDLRIKFVNSNSSAILSNCRMIDRINNRKFAFLVEKITFVTEK